MDDNNYWEPRLAEDPDAKYRFYLARMALKLQYAMPMKKAPEISNKVVRAVKHVMNLGPEYTYRRRIVILCNIQMINQYKLESQHGINFNRKAYRRLVHAGIEHPNFDEADVMINNYIYLKRMLLMFLSRDVIAMKWPKQLRNTVEILQIEQFIEQTVDEIKANVILICKNPENISSDKLYYIDHIIKRYNQQSFSSSDLLKRLKKVKQYWQIPSTLI